MSRSKTIDLILKLSPPSPGNSDKLRAYLERLSARELERTRADLEELETQSKRDATNAESAGIEERIANLLADAEGVVADWTKADERIAAWVNQAIAEICESPSVAGTGATIDPITGERENEQSGLLSILGSSPTEHSLVNLSSKDLLDETDLDLLAKDLSWKIIEAEILVRINTYVTLHNRISASIADDSIIESPYKRKLLAKLIVILPWDWFTGSVLRLRRRLSWGEPIDVPRDNISLNLFLSLLRDAFSGLRPRATPSLSEGGDVDTYVNLLNFLWFFDLNLLPSDVRATLMRTIDVGADALKQQLSNSLQRDTSERITQFERTTQSFVRSHLLATRIRVTLSAADIVSRSRNLVSALRQANRASFFSTKTWYLDQIVLDELEACAGLITADPAAYEKNALSESATVTGRPPNKILALLAAAEVLTFHGRALYRLQNRPDEALQTLARAERYFEYLQGSTDSSQVTISWARKRLLDATIATVTGDADRALKDYDFSIHLLRVSSTKERDTVQRSILRASVLIEKAQSFGVDEATNREIVDTLTSLNDDQPEIQAAWQLLFRYIRNVRRDLPAALKHLGEWINSVQTSTTFPKRKVTLELMRASILHDMSEHDKSFIAEAITSYVKVLRDDTSNVTAVTNLLKLHAQLSISEIPKVISSLTQELASIDASPCSLAHAIISSAFSRDLTPRFVKMDAVASAYTNLVENENPQAQATVANAIANDFTTSILIELASKFFFQKGRSDRASSDLAIADRLLRAGLSAQQTDLVWLSRRIDIALVYHRISQARELLHVAIETFPSDPILAHQSARISLAENKPLDAIATLRPFVFREGLSPEQDDESVHPAILDQFAIAALRNRDFELAMTCYSKNLKINPCDPRSWIGLGRVHYEKGRQHWPKALKNWLTAIRLQTEAGDRTFGRRTANLVVGLFDPVNADEVLNADSDGGLDKTLIDELGLDLKLDSKLARTLANGFVRAGVASPGIVNFYISLAEFQPDRLLARSISKLLMVRSIEATITEENTSARQQVEKAVAWCLARGLLADYLSGARGMYPRIALRMQTEHGHLAYGLLQHFDSPVLPGKWKPFMEQLSNFSYEDSYNFSFEDIAKEIEAAPVDQIAAFVASVIVENFRRVRGITRTRELLAGMEPAISLKMLNTDRVANGKSLAAWVDSDIFTLAEKFLNGGGWRSDATEIVREAAKLPSVEEAEMFSSGGIFFRPTLGQPGNNLCYAYTLPEWSRSTYELN